MPFFPSSGSSVISVTQIPFCVKTAPYNAVGNGIADDTAAIQACVDAAFAAAKYQGYYSVYVPQGAYKVTGSIITPGGCHWVGDGFGSEIFGAINDAIIKDVAFGNSGYSPAADTFDGLSIINTGGSATSYGIKFSAGKQSVLIQHCLFSTDGDAVTHQRETFNGVFQPVIINNEFVATPYGRAHGAAGIRLIVTGYEDAGNYFQGWAFARVLCGQGIKIDGGRGESNDVNVLLGQDPAGNLVSAQGFSVDSHWFEANNVGIRIRSGNNGKIANMLGNQWGEIQPPDQNPVYGILIEAGTDISVENVSVGGDFSSAAIQVNSGVQNLRFVNVTASNSTATGAVWSVMAPPDEVSFENTNYTPDTGVTVANSKYDVVAARGLSTLDYLDDTVLSKNLGGSVAVGSAATSVAVLFPTALDATANSITSLTQGTGGTLTLLAPYHYQVGLVTPTGEVQGSSLSATTLTGSNNKITVNLANVTATYAGYAFAKRLYRGTGLTGAYQGYWDLSGSTNSFVDTGSVAFDGVKQPNGNHATSITAAEADALYGVLVTVGWDTRWWITNVATTGFTIHFSSAPGSDTSVKWLIYR